MSNLRFDLPASIAVFLVALPLCLGIALASGEEVPLIAGLIAGIIGGILVGSISGSHTSVSGPAAGLVAIVLSQVEMLGSFQAFLCAVFIAGILQIALGIVRAGVIAYYFPSSVIRGLLAAIGVILILKQIPHAVGYDVDAEGDFSFFQSDGENTFSELLQMFNALEPLAMVISVACLLLMVFWQRTKLASSPIPAALAAVVLGVVLNEVAASLVPAWALGASHRVDLGFDVTDPESTMLAWNAWLTFPDFSMVGDPKLYLAALTIALVASLESLLNLEAVDRLDTQRRVSPTNRELIAQGVGNVTSGLLGGLPVTSVIVRSSTNVYSGSRTKLSAILHGVWLLGTVAMIPGLLQRIPFAALAAILLVTGYKLASPSLFLAMYRRGWNQLVPFVVTIVAIVFTDLLRGIVIGLVIGIFFILRSMERSPFLSEQRMPVQGNVTRLKLGQYVSFLNRSRILRTLEKYNEGTQLILDASSTQYIDPDVLETIREFRQDEAPKRNLSMSLVGFHQDHKIPTEKSYTDTVTPEAQQGLTPMSVLELLKQGNRRYCDGQMIERDWSHQREQTKASQHPMAAMLSCIDSRVPVELVFDVGIGDLFSTRVAGNVVNEDVLGSLEYASEVAGVKLIVILGHTKCGAVSAACQGVKLGHVTELISKISPMAEELAQQRNNADRASDDFVNEVARRNVMHVVEQTRQRSPIIDRLVQDGKLAIIGGLYDLHSGKVTFYDNAEIRSV
ncbi:MAG: carbonic anhydrase family protein [Planctomycetota bacterium]